MKITNKPKTEYITVIELNEEERREFYLFLKDTRAHHNDVARKIKTLIDATPINPGIMTTAAESAQQAYESACAASSAVSR